MQVALMVPCYIDMFYPRVGTATLELLERLGVDVANLSSAGLVEFPPTQHY
jgi:Fe-S oxidoreductase